MPPQQGRNSEHPDPHEQNNPVPRVVVVLAFALVVWAVWYILVSQPDGVAALGDRRVPAALASVDPPGPGAVDGRQIYVANCQACHQASGKGLPGVFPPLAGVSWVNGDPQILAQILLHGLTGPVEVSGQTYNGAMPAFGTQLDDAQIAAVLSFIRSEWGNESPVVGAAAVAAARRASAQRSEPWQGIEEIPGPDAR